MPHEVENVERFLLEELPQAVDRGVPQDGNLCSIILLQSLLEGLGLSLQI
jgi:hypothetical protein